MRLILLFTRSTNLFKCSLNPWLFDGEKVKEETEAKHKILQFNVLTHIPAMASGGIMSLTLKGERRSTRLALTVGLLVPG